MQTLMDVAGIHETLAELIERLSPGDEVILMREQKPVATLLIPSSPMKPPRPGPGLCKGMITYLAPDFDSPLDDLKIYMDSHL